MTVQGFGACMLVAMMRRDRVADLDTSWLLHGPSEPESEPEAEAELPPVLRWAAE